MSISMEEPKKVEVKLHISVYIGLLQLLLIHWKLANYISVSWWVVSLPSTLPIALYCLSLVLVAIANVIKYILEKRR